MNRVGEMGRGESVWLGWFLHTRRSWRSRPWRGYAPTDERQSAWLAHAAALSDSLEQEAWDGEWYRRGYFDDGTPLGSSANAECRIDCIAQSWSVISGAAERSRAERAMAAVEKSAHPT